LTTWYKSGENDLSCAPGCRKNKTRIQKEEKKHPGAVIFYPNKTILMSGGAEKSSNFNGL
jgi:hypothetical protein